MPNLTLKDRVALVRAALSKKPDPQQQAAMILSRIYGGQQGDPPERGTQGILNSYTHMPWVRACAGKVAASLAAVEWRLYATRKGKGANRKAYRDRTLQRAGLERRKGLLTERANLDELDEITDHPFLDSLTKGNGYHTGVALRRIESVHLDLVGETFLLKSRNGVGAPVAFWPIPPTWIAATPTPSHPTYRINYQGWHEEIPASEILWMCDPNPAQPYSRGVGLGQAISDEAEIDDYSAKFCHDDTTECLTRRGWVRGLDVVEDDEIATWNERLHCIEYQRPLVITRVQHDGVMHHWNGGRINAMVTPNHRMWIWSKIYRRPARPEPVWHFEESREIVRKPGRSFKWRDAGYYDGAKGSVQIPAAARRTKRKAGSRGGGRPPRRGVNDPLTFTALAFAPFLGYYVSEGSPNAAAACIGQSEGGCVEQIRAALTIFPREWVKERAEKTASGKTGYRWTVNHHGLTEWLRAQAGEGAYYKRLPTEVFEWPHAAQRALLVALINGDGHWTKTQACSYFSMSDGLIDDVQRLAVHVGWSSRKGPRKKSGGTTLYMKTETSVRHVYKPNGAWVKEVPYGGLVWCVTVSNEKFFTRRDGCVLLGGNSRQVFFNRAQPDFIIYPKGERAEMHKPETTRFEQDWINKLQGYWRSARPYFLSREVGVYEFQKNIKDLMLVEIRNQERDIILQTWGIPPEQLGIVANSNRSTIEGSDLVFSKGVLVPRLEFRRAIYQEQVIPEYDDRLIVDYVTPVMEDKEFSLKVAQAAPWAMDGNEWRAIMGLGEKDEFDGVYFVPPAVTPVSRDQLQMDTIDLPDRGAATGEVPRPTPEGQAKPTAEGKPAAPTGNVGGDAVTAPTVSLNGAQVSALIEIITAVAEGRIPRGTGVLAIMTAFAISRELADQLMGEVGAGFVPAAPVETGEVSPSQ